MEEDRRLIEQIRLTHSSVASSKLVDKYKSRVFTFCSRMVKDREWAEEIAQDAFMKALDKIDSLNDLAKFYPWLMKLTYYVTIDHLRRKRVPVDSIEQAHEIAAIDDPHAELVAGDKVRLVEALLLRLPEEDRSIVTLFYLEDMRIRDIEEITGLTATNIKVKLFRSRQVLRKDFEKFVKELRYE